MNVLKNKYFKKVLKLFLVLFLCMNIVACFHAYKFTHFSPDKNKITKNPEQLSLYEKVSTLLFGVSLPRPINNITPSQNYKTVRIYNNELECWEIETPNAKGTILVFHGYGNKKSGMLDRSDEFCKMGYNVVLMDFHGSGGSDGMTTTIGFKEGNDVKECYNYYSKKYVDKPIFLMGSSMGAASIMKCLNDYSLKANAIILECPFGSMYKTVVGRFESMKLPSFPMAGLLVFYGGIINGFWAFNHNPIDYAKNINCPTLLLSGGQDERVTQLEIEDIYQNLKGNKKIIIYPNSGHESYLNDYSEKWISDVTVFLESNR